MAAAGVGPSWATEGGGARSIPVAKKVGHRGVLLAKHVSRDSSCDLGVDFPRSASETRLAGAKRVALGMSSATNSKRWSLQAVGLIGHVAHDVGLRPPAHVTLQLADIRRFILDVRFADVINAQARCPQ